MARFNVHNKAELPVHVELIHDGVIHHCKCDVKPGVVADFFVAPVIWNVWASFACDATKTDHSKTIDPDATVIIKNKQYYIAGVISEDYHLGLGLSRSKYKVFWNLTGQIADTQRAEIRSFADSLEIGGVRIPQEIALLLIGFQGEIASDALQRVTLAVSKEVYDGVTLKALSGTRDCEISVEGGALDFALDPTLLLFTASVKSPLAISRHDPH